MEKLAKEFGLAVQNVTIRDAKLQRAIDAHTEIRELLEADQQFRDWGIDTILIGSYARHTARYPGKDVDVFLRFTKLSVRHNPATIYDAVQRILIDAYGEADVDPGGRVTKQPRSLKVSFDDPDEPDTDLSFSIDAVPAVPWNGDWGIPNREPNKWKSTDRRWVKTNPVAFAEKSETLSTAAWSPTVDGRNAYPAVTRLLRQARHIHLGEDRPGGLYAEVAGYYAWNDRRVSGDSWAELLTATLVEVAIEFRKAATSGLPDPVLGTPMTPALTPEQWRHTADVFDRLGANATTALSATRCKAAQLWRDILGGNDRGQVLPLPAGCDANGFPISSIAAVNTLGSDEPRGFA